MPRLFDPLVFDLHEVAGQLTAQPLYVQRKRVYQHEWYVKNRDRLIAKAAARYAANRDEIIAKWHEQRRAAGVKPRRELDRLSKTDRRRYYLEYLVEDALRRRIRLLQKVSGQRKPTCARCGLDELLALEVNHMNGGGARETTHRHGKSWLGFCTAILNGDRTTDDLNVLCASCNRLYEYQRGARRLPSDWESLVTELTGA